jgi:hypothetical protein
MGATSFGLILALGSMMTANAPTWSRVVGIIPFFSTHFQDRGAASSLAGRNRRKPL